MKNTYYILRHGQTLYQTEKKDQIYPWPETFRVELTEAGKEQIRLVARDLKSRNIDLIYSSDATRTRQSAGIVAEWLGLDEPIIDARLRDVNLGVYNGGPGDRFYSDFPNNIERFTKRPDGGENWNDCRKRMMDFFNEIERNHEGKTILIVSHSDPLMILQGTLEGLSDEEILEGKIKNNLIKPGELRKLNV